MSLDSFDPNEGMSLEDLHHDVLLQIEAILFALNPVGRKCPISPTKTKAKTKPKRKKLRMRFSST